jgi:tRNA(adenine34) deaminase
MMVFFSINGLQCFAANTNPIGAKKSDEYYMQIAISLAKNNPKAPFAALIVDNKTGKILSKGLNSVQVNPAFHGEMVALNNCVKKNPQVDWAQVTLFTTAEPCPMCQSAVVWAKIPRVVFATSMGYLINHGWNQINIRASEINKRSPFYKGTITGGILASQSNVLYNSL